MPWSLKRYQHTHRHLHFITFSCYRREPFLDSARTRNLFESALERTRLGYQFFITGYVVMPEHVHMLGCPILSRSLRKGGRQES